MKNTNRFLALVLAAVLAISGISIEGKIANAADNVEMSSELVGEATELGDEYKAEIIAETKAETKAEMESEIKADKAEAYDTISIMPSFARSVHKVNSTVTVPFYMCTYNNYDTQNFYVYVYNPSGELVGSLSKNFPRKVDVMQYTVTFTATKTGTYKVRYYYTGDKTDRYATFTVNSSNSAIDLTDATIYRDDNEKELRLKTEFNSATTCYLDWYYSLDDGATWNEIQTGIFESTNEITFLPEKTGYYKFKFVVRHMDEDGSASVSKVLDYSYYKYIKATCQMPYEGEGGGYLIGVQSFDNPDQSYLYELLVLDCNLYLQGLPAWIYTSYPCRVEEGTTMWTIWQPKYGYYWTLFRVYDQNGNLLEEACYGFVNAW